MTLSTAEIKIMTFDELYQVLIPTLHNIRDEYSYISLSTKSLDNWFKKIMVAKYQKIINSDREEKIDFSLIIKNNINWYLRKTFALENGTEIFNRFIDKNIEFTNDYQIELKKISDFFLRMGYLPNDEFYLEVLKNNKKVNIILSKLVEDNKQKLKNSRVEELFSDSVFVSLIENYCTLNKISFNKSKNNIILESKYTDNDLLNYFNTINLPLLSKREEQELAIKVKNGDDLAKKTMIERNLKLVVSIARTYHGTGVDILDLIQDGNIGLIKALERFDVTKGYRFSTYATWWIKDAITKSLANNGTPFHITVHTLRKIYKLRSVSEKLEQVLNREPTEEELARELGVSLANIKKLNNVWKNNISLNETLGKNDEQIIGNDVNPESIVIDKIMKEEINKAISKLTKREQEVVNLRFGFDDCGTRTFSEAGTILNISGERARQLEISAIKKMKNDKFLAEYKSKVYQKR